MPNERLLRALSRIEAAAARIETLALASPDTAPAGWIDSAVHDDLLERHRRLRLGASEALLRIDRLLDTSPATAPADSPLDRGDGWV